MGKTYSQSKSYSRLIAVGLQPTEAASIAKLIQKWVDNCGEEHTVVRLKSFKDAYLHKLVGLSFDLPWWKKDVNGNPKGPFRVLWKFSKNKMFRCWNAIMVYTSMTYQFSGKMPRMTARQYAKFVKAVGRPQVDHQYDDLVHGLITNFLSVYSFPKFRASTGTPVVSLPCSDTRRAPDTKGYLKSSVESETLVSSISVLAQRPNFTKKFWSIYEGVLKGFEETWSQFAWTTEAFEYPLSGRIGIIQEPGYKARIVANPYRVHQAALLPLKEYLFSLLRKIPNDYVYNQEGGVQHVQNMLLEGKTAYSVDLTNASDNLPLCYQEHLLRLLGIPEDWVGCFSSVSSGDWELPVQWLPAKEKVAPYLDGNPEGYYPWNGQSRLRWTVGQPLGLGPSFASAFLFHHAIVVGICSMLQKPLDYAMVGDDLVLFDEEVYHWYVLFMGWIGVPVAKEKSLVSSRAGEFLSRIIFPDFILRGYKWKGSGDNSFWDVAKHLGPKSLRLFQPRQRAVLRAIGHLPEPYGVGWNPDGLSWWDRMEIWLEAFEKLDVRERSFVSTVSSLNFRLYTGNLKFRTDKGYPLSAIPDQGIEAFVRAELSNSVAKLGELMLPNLDYLAQLYDVRCPASEDKQEFIRRVSSFLKDFTVLERMCDITTLIRTERIISRVTRRE